MPSSFTLRMQFGPHQDPDEVGQQLLRLVRKAPVDEVMLFFFAEELNDGHETPERLRAWVDRSRPYRQALAQAGVRVSLNPWHSLLHCDRHRRLKPGQSWQTMVDPHGRACEAVVCPLDPGWQAYFEDSLRLYAGEGFRVIWIDDDIRYHNHDPLDWGGCFCPLHVAAFAQRVGVRTERAQIVAACAAPGEPHPWRSEWMDLWQETQLELLSRWRRVVEAGGARLGLMSSAPEAHAAEGRRWEEWWRVFGGEGEVVHRPHFWGYGDALGPSLIESIALLDQNRWVQPPAVENGPEIECFPYGRWNKSFRQVGAQMALAQVMGATHLNISLYDFMGNRPDDEPERAAFLAAWKPTCDWLSELFPPHLAPVGIGVPWDQDMGRRLRTVSGGRWQALTCPTRGWAQWLGAAGQAFCMRPAARLNALAGPVTWSFTDEQLRAWLGQGLLVDGEAAAILCERGLGHLIGALGGSFTTQAEALYAVEHCLVEDLSLREGAEISVNAHPYARRLFQAELDPDAFVASELRSPTQARVGHGLYLFANELGGRVAVLPWSAHAGVQMNVQRAAQLAKVLDWLDRTGSWGSVAGGPWLVPQFLRHGDVWRGVVWNAGPDEVEQVVVRLPAGMPAIQTAVQVASRGTRFSAEVERNIIRLSRPLYQWEFVVLC